MYQVIVNGITRQLDLTFYLLLLEMVQLQLEVIDQNKKVKQEPLIMIHDWIFDSPVLQGVKGAKWIFLLHTTRADFKSR